MVSSPSRVNAKTYKTGIFCFSAKHTALRSKIKDWLAQNKFVLTDLFFGELGRNKSH